MTTEVVQLAAENPTAASLLASLVGSAIGGGVAALAGVRRGFRREAREVANERVKKHERDRHAAAALAVDPST